MAHLDCKDRAWHTKVAKTAHGTLAKTAHGTLRLQRPRMAHLQRPRMAHLGCKDRCMLSGISCSNLSRFKQAAFRARASADSQMLEGDPIFWTAADSAEQQRYGTRPKYWSEPRLKTDFAEPRLRTGFAEPGLRTGFAEPWLRTGFREPWLRTGFREPRLRTGFAQNPDKVIITAMPERKGPASTNRPTTNWRSCKD